MWIFGPFVEDEEKEDYGYAGMGENGKCMILQQIYFELN